MEASLYFSRNIFFAVVSKFYFVSRSDPKATEEVSPKYLFTTFEFINARSTTPGCFGVSRLLFPAPAPGHILYAEYQQQNEETVSHYSYCFKLLKNKFATRFVQGTPFTLVTLQNLNKVWGLNKVEPVSERLSKSATTWPFGKSAFWPETLSSTVQRFFHLFLKGVPCCVTSSSSGTSKTR